MLPPLDRPHQLNDEFHFPDAEQIEEEFTIQQPHSPKHSSYHKTIHQEECHTFHSSPNKNSHNNTTSFALSLHTDHSTRQYQNEYAVLLRPRTHKFDSIDFRTPPSKLNVQILLNKTLKEQRTRDLFTHLVAAAVGITIGIIAFIIDQAILWIHVGIYKATTFFFIKNPLLSAFFFVSVNATLVILASVLILFLSPVSSGSGVPEVKALLNGVNVPGLLRFNTLVIKSTSLILGLGGGLLSGKQGPLNHIGAIIGAGLSQGASSTFKFRIQSNLLRPLRTSELKRDFVALGSAVGAAVAYGAPLGGTLWSLEEAVTHMSMPLAWLTAFASLFGVLTVGWLRNVAQGMPMSISFSQIGISPGTPSLHLLDLPFFFLLGIIGGLFGAAVPIFVRWVTIIRHKHAAKSGIRVLEVFVMSLLISTSHLVVPLIFSECIQLSQVLEQRGEYLPEHLFSNYSCSNGGKSMASALAFGPPSETLRALLFNNNQDRFSVTLMLVTLTFYIVLAILSNGIAASIGLFAPTMVIGALYGRILGVLIHRVFPGHAGDVKSYALVGCVSALSGMTRLSVSVCVLVLEATGASLIEGFPSVCSAITAKLLADALTIGIFDMQIALKGLPVFSPRDRHPHLYNTTIVRDVMSPTVVAVPTSGRIEDYLSILKNHKHNSFPVFCHEKKDSQKTPLLTNDYEVESVNEPDEIQLWTPRAMSISNGTDSLFSKNSHVPNARESVIPTCSSRGMKRRGMKVTEDEELLDGIIDRESLLAVIEHCTRQIRSQLNWTWHGSTMTREELDTAWPNMDRVDREDEIAKEVSEEGKKCYIDLSDILDPNPLLISDAASTGEVRKLLRLTGARHVLAVYTRRGRIVGIVTRKDVIPEALKELYEEDSNSDT